MKYFFYSLVLFSFLFSSCGLFLDSKKQKPASVFWGMGHRPLLQQQYLQNEILSVRFRYPLHPVKDVNPLTWKIDTIESATPILDLDKHLLFAGSSQGKVSCFVLETGKLKWTSQLSGRIVSQPLVDEDFLYIGTTRGVFYALELESGKIKWSYQANGEILSQATKTTDSSLIVFSTSNNRLYALHSETGKWAWQYKRDMSEQLSIRGQSSPTFHQGNVFAGFSDGVLVSLEAKSGKLRWERSLGERERFADIDTKAIFAHNLLYTSSYSGSLHALQPNTGKTVWKKRMLGASTVALSEDHLFVANSEGMVWSLNPKTGTEHWKKSYPKAGSFEKPAVSKDYVFLNSQGLGIMVLSKRDGSLMQALRFGSGFSGQPYLQEDFLFSISNGRFLYAFSLKKHRIRRHNRY